MIQLPKREQPELWFVETFKDGSETRVRLLADQYVPLDKQGNYELSDVKLKVQCEKEAREQNVIGTLFALKAMIRVQKNVSGGKKGQPYYSSHPDEKLYPLIGPHAKETPPEFIQAYSEWIRGKKAPRLSITPPPVSQATTTVQNSSLIDDLIRQYPKPEPKTDGFYVDTLVWNRLIFNLKKGHNTLLVGDSGSGKTELSTLLAKRFGMGLEMFDMGSKTDPVSSLIGSHRHNTQQGGSYFQRAKFSFAIEKENTIVLLDEISRPSPLTNNILLPVLDSRKVLQMDMAMDGNDMISVNPDCRFIATANVGFEYSGTQALDRALMERFKVIKIDYPPADIEADLLTLRTKVNKKPAGTIVKVAGTIREMHKNGELSTGVSLRHTLDAAELQEGGFDLATAMEMAFMPSFQYHEAEKVLEILSSR